MSNEEMKNLNQEALNEVAGGADGRRYYVDRFGGEKVAVPFVSEAEAQAALEAAQRREPDVLFVLTYEN